MSEDWGAIAAEVAVGLAEVGVSTTLRRKGAKSGPDNDPTYGSPTDYTVTVVNTKKRYKDENGTLTGVTMTTLLVAATGVVPEKSDTIFVSGVEQGIEDVIAIEPAGTAVLYKVELES